MSYSAPDSDLFDTRQQDSIATFTCDAGYERVGPGQSRCNNGVWDGAFPTCELLFCPETEILNGAVSITNPPGNEFGKRNEGSEITVSCDLGYIVEGNSTGTCQNGNWDIVFGECVVN